MSRGSPICKNCIYILSNSFRKITFTLQTFESNPWPFAARLPLSLSLHFLSFQCVCQQSRKGQKKKEKKEWKSGKFSMWMAKNQKTQEAQRLEQV